MVTAVNGRYVSHLPYFVPPPYHVVVKKLTYLLLYTVAACPGIDYQTGLCMSLQRCNVSHITPLLCYFHRNTRPDKTTELNKKG